MIMPTLIKPKIQFPPLPDESGPGGLEQKRNEENISTFPEKAEEDPRIFCPEGFPRRSERDQEPPEKGPEEIGCQLRR